MKKILELKQVSFTYAEEKERALDDISMTLEEGGFYLLCGRSGCGKSTLLRQMKSALTPKGICKGEIRYCGRKLSEVSCRIQCEEIGFVFQNPEDQLVTDEVWHELAFGLENLGYQSGEIHMRVAETASYLGLEKCFEKKTSELSGGQKQLLNLASVLVLRPRLLLLDEPFSQLDPLAAQDFFHTLLRLHQEMGLTVLLSEHELEETFPYADKIFVMEQGRISAEGRREEIGCLLHEKNHEMFLSMPSPLRISAWCGEKEHLPYTVAAGKEWMERKLFGEKVFEKKMHGSFEEGAFLEDRKKRSKESGKHAEGKTGISGKGEMVLEIKNAWFRYGRSGDPVLRELSLSVKRGEIFSLLGGNGSGKSTLLRVISGFLSLERGRIFLFGEGKKEKERKRMFPHRLGCLPQDAETLFVRDSLLEDFLDITDREHAEAMAERMGLSGLLLRHPYDLSCGERQKAALAKVLLSRPELILLDEPTKGLDVFYKKELGKLFRLLQEEGKTIFFVSHDVSFCAEYADRAGLYFRGNVHAVSGRKTFFSRNQFYTTAAYRMAKDYYPDAVTAEEVVDEILSAH